jgi:hypothetical protein
MGSFSQKQPKHLKLLKKEMAMSKPAAVAAIELKPPTAPKKRLATGAINYEDAVMQAIRSQQEGNANVKTARDRLLKNPVFSAEIAKYVRLACFCGQMRAT